MSDKFYKEHTLKQFSAPLFAYFKLTISDKNELNDMINSASKGQLSKDRQKDVIEEAEAIKALEDPALVVRYMKRLKEISNQEVLASKVLSMEADTIPTIIEKLAKTANDTFVEIAVMVLAKCDRGYIDKLYENYENIMYPYAQSNAAMVLGIRDVQAARELLMKEVCRFEKEYPNEDFAQAPLIGLYALDKKQLV